MGKRVRKIVFYVLIVPIGTIAGAVAAVAISGSDAPQDERPSVSDMSPEEQIAAMDMRTLPNGKTIGHKPVGVEWTVDDLPDFIAAKYGGGKVGYVRKTDVFEPPADSPEEAAERTMQKLREGPRTIPVFSDDGQTVIAEKQIGGGSSVEELKDGTVVTYDFENGTITTVAPDGHRTVEDVRE